MVTIYEDRKLLPHAEASHFTKLLPHAEAPKWIFIGSSGSSRALFEIGMGPTLRSSDKWIFMGSFASSDKWTLRSSDKWTLSQNGYGFAFDRPEIGDGMIKSIEFRDSYIDFIDFNTIV